LTRLWEQPGFQEQLESLKWVFKCKKTAAAAATAGYLPIFCSHAARSIRRRVLVEEKDQVGTVLQAPGQSSLRTIKLLIPGAPAAGDYLYQDSGKTRRWEKQGFAL
jgi:hypothetical protein